MDVGILISKTLLLKIELHAAVRIFTTEKPTLLPDSEKNKHWGASLQSYYVILIS